MNKLLLTSVLALSLVLPLSSYAGVNAFGVDLPLNQAEVSDSVSGGYVATDLGDTFQIQKLSNNDTPIRSDSVREKYVVFGVDLNSINNS